MDGKKAKAPALPVPPGSDAANATSSSPRAPPSTPLLDAAAAAPPVDAPAAAAGCEEEEDDDEQMERFYALLANIRAMRGMYTAGGAADDIGETAGSSGKTRKRWRGAADAPWRPAFRLEDFEEAACSTPDAARCAKRKQRQEQADDGGESGARPAVAPSPPPPCAGVRSFDSSGKNI